MSTYLYLRCEEHDPPLLSADEVTQHAHNEREMADVLRWVRDRERLVAAHRDYGLDLSDYYLSHAVTFLSQHPKCRLGLEDEYGDEWDIETGRRIETATEVEAIINEAWGNQ